MWPEILSDGCEDGWPGWSNSVIATHGLLWSSISVLKLGSWRSLWSSVHNLMLGYPLISICLLILLVWGYSMYSCDLMLLRWNRLKLKYLLSSCGTDTSEVGFSTIYGRSFRSSYGEGLRYSWDSIAPLASLSVTSGTVWSLNRVMSVPHKQEMSSV